MKLETFSYLPQMTDEQLVKQVRYIINQGLIPAIEFTGDPDPYESYWAFWDLPMTGEKDANKVLAEIDACRTAHPDCFIKVVGYDNVKQCQATAFVAYRPE